MATAYADRLAPAREHAATMPLDQIDPATVQHFADGVELPYFERLRRDDPVHHAVEHALRDAGLSKRDALYIVPLAVQGCARQRWKTAVWLDYWKS